ncbi:alpha/beta-hydrolase family protein [Propionibacterium australiense]|uniref:Uncharacterized protein n=1 Tax=Propionibacterium australiense TaxID=119981 RepID=A0A8B3FQN6_9ACTN|nr:alpha/beta-hydrolase family protein [Propionibacterium australiense]RLP07163.1 hypothetical protein D9T14_10460 [Propionibacterium australiense]RLP07549.1 hypothetical protein D7U36_11110 [Propionibacterium australiense]
MRLPRPHLSPGRRSRIRRPHAEPPSVGGSIGALAGYVAAYSPSLLPRTWAFQGVIAAISSAFGYQVGMLTGWAGGLLGDVLGLRFDPRKLSRGGQRALTVAALAAAAAAAVGVPLAAQRSQRRTARACHADEPTAGWQLASAAATAGVFLLLQAQWRATAAAIDWVGTRLHGRIAWRVAERLVATLVVLTTIVAIFDTVILHGVIQVGRTASGRLDLTTPDGMHEPSSPNRSGSPASREAWSTLGLQGKIFVTGGPDAVRIAQVTAGPAREPLRVYAAMGSRSLRGLTEAVLAEMDRTDAWSRANLCIVTTTGRGSANEWSASAFEYLTRGDCCTIGMQYSGLPSAITLFTDKQIPVVASRALFEAIERRLLALPPDRRPRVYMAGESLGAFGSNGVFTDVDDLLARVDGAVWMGAPDFTPLKSELTAGRDEGSTVVVPVVDGGRHVRFAGQPWHLTHSEFGRELGPWAFPRIVYLQNDTDPVVWWGTRLLWRRPEWFDGLRAPDSTMARMHWVPFVTFWQVACDMPVCARMLEGFGHKYSATQVVPAWASVLGGEPTDDNEAIVEALVEDIRGRRAPRR